MLTRSPNVPPGAAKAWMEAFAEHPGRAAIAGSYAAAHIAENPAEALALAKDFTPWERQQFLNAAIPQWAAKDPAAVLAWLRLQTQPVPNSLRSRIFEAWADANPDSARAELAILTDPDERLELARALGHAMADQGTREAVAWAESLPEPALRDAVHEAIYEATPRGIGALMANEEGFPTIKGVLPDSAAQQAGLQTGDRLVEISGASGEFTLSLWESPSGGHQRDTWRTWAARAPPHPAQWARWPAGRTRSRSHPPATRLPPADRLRIDLSSLPRPIFFSAVVVLTLRRACGNGGEFVVFRRQAAFRRPTPPRPTHRKSQIVNRKFPQMPKDTSLHKILLIGSGPIVIGQGCEFDYSGCRRARPCGRRDTRWC